MKALIFNWTVLFDEHSFQVKDGAVELLRFALGKKLRIGIVSCTEYAEGFSKSVEDLVKELTLGRKNEHDIFVHEGFFCDEKSVLGVLRGLRLAPKDALYVDREHHGLGAIKQLGLTTVCLSDAKASTDEPKPADYVVHSLGNVREMVSRIVE